MIFIAISLSFIYKWLKLRHLNNETAKMVLNFLNRRLISFWGSLKVWNLTKYHKVNRIRYLKRDSTFSHESTLFSLVI